MSNAISGTNSPKTESWPGKKLGKVDQFCCMDSQILLGGSVSDEVTSCIHKALSTLTDLRDLWPTVYRPNVQFTLQQ